jgi:glycosyltransferase involved in cell wall biosynthesis
MRQESKLPLILIAGGSTWVRGGLERYCERLASLLTSCDVAAVVRHPTNSAVLKTKNIFRALVAFCRGVAGLINQYRKLADQHRETTIVWLQYGNALDLLVIVALAAVARQRFLCTLHASNTWKHQRSTFGRKLTNLILRLPARVFVLADFQARELQGAGIANIERLPTLLPDWVNTPPSSAVRRDSRKLLFVGRVNKQKGFEDVLYLVKTLVHHGYEPTLTIVGPPELDASKEIRQVGLEKFVEFVGECDEVDVLGHLQSSRLLVLPSYVDTYPLVLLEAAVTGTYVVAYDLEGATEILREFGGGVAVPIGNRAALVSAAVHALERNPDMTEVAKLARARLAWRNVANSYLRAIDLV